MRDNLGASSSDLLEETHMQSSEVYVYGSGATTRQVKIIDKSKRAFDTSGEAVKSLELTLRKPRSACKHTMLRIRGFFYALWLLCFKHHGIPPRQGTRYSYFLGFAVFTALDILLTAITCLHMFSPIDNWKVIGIPFFFISPGVTLLGPFCGFLACIIASPNMLKFQASANATAVLLNYPLTLAVMFYVKHEPFYNALIIVLWFNKISLSFCGAKVRQHLINPAFIRNATKIEDRFNLFV